MRLHSRVYLHSLAVLLVVGAATTLVFAFVDRGGMFREMGERVARHAAGLAAEGVHDPVVLARRVGDLHRTLDVDVAVRDLDGRELAGRGGSAATAGRPGGRRPRRTRDGPRAAPVRDGPRA